MQFRAGTAVRWSIIRLFNLFNINKNICIWTFQEKLLISILLLTYFHLVFILKKSKELDYMVFFENIKLS